MLASHDHSGPVGTPNGIGYLVTIIKPYDYDPESGPNGRLFERPS